MASVRQGARKTVLPDGHHGPTIPRVGDLIEYWVTVYDLPVGPAVPSRDVIRRGYVRRLPAFTDGPFGLTFTVYMTKAGSRGRDDRVKPHQIRRIHQERYHDQLHLAV